MWIANKALDAKILDRFPEGAVLGFTNAWITDVWNKRIDSYFRSGASVNIASEWGAFNIVGKIDIGLDIFPCSVHTTAHH